MAPVQFRCIPSENEQSTSLTLDSAADGGGHATNLPHENGQWRVFVGLGDAVPCADIVQQEVAIGMDDRIAQELRNFVGAAVDASLGFGVLYIAT